MISNEKAYSFSVLFFQPESDTDSRDHGGTLFFVFPSESLSYVMKQRCKVKQVWSLDSLEGLVISSFF